MTMLCQLVAGWRATWQYHPACVKMGDSIAAMIQALITTDGWVCHLCRTELVQLRSVKTDILEMVGTVKEELKQLRIDFVCYQTAHPTSVSSPVPLWALASALSGVCDSTYCYQLCLQCWHYSYVSLGAPRIFGEEEM